MLDTWCLVGIVGPSHAVNQVVLLAASSDLAWASLRASMRGDTHLAQVEKWAPGLVRVAQAEGSRTVFISLAGPFEDPNVGQDEGSKAEGVETPASNTSQPKQAGQREGVLDLPAADAPRPAHAERHAMCSMLALMLCCDAVLIHYGSSTLDVGRGNTGWIPRLRLLQQAKRVLFNLASTGKLAAYSNLTQALSAAPPLLLFLLQATSERPMPSPSPIPPDAIARLTLLLRKSVAPEPPKPPALVQLPASSPAVMVGPPPTQRAAGVRSVVLSALGSRAVGRDGESAEVGRAWGSALRSVMGGCRESVKPRSDPMQLLSTFSDLAAVLVAGAAASIDPAASIEAYELADDESGVLSAPLHTTPLASALGPLEQLCDIPYKNSVVRCRKALKLAVSRYAQGLPPRYGRHTHKAALATAVSTYDEIATGPAAAEIKRGLIPRCDAIWKAGRQRCPHVSLSGTSCDSGPHDVSKPHVSSSSMLCTSHCGSFQTSRPDPFTLVHANEDKSLDPVAATGSSTSEFAASGTVRTGAPSQQRAARAAGNRGRSRTTAIAVLDLSGPADDSKNEAPSPPEGDATAGSAPIPKEPSSSLPSPQYLACKSVMVARLEGAGASVAPLGPWLVLTRIGSASMYHDTRGLEGPGWLPGSSHLLPVTVTLPPPTVDDETEFPALAATSASKRRHTKPATTSGRARGEEDPEFLRERLKAAWPSAQSSFAGSGGVAPFKGSNAAQGGSAKGSRSKSSTSNSTLRLWIGYEYEWQDGRRLIASPSLLGPRNRAPRTLSTGSGSSGSTGMGGRFLMSSNIPLYLEAPAAAKARTAGTAEGTTPPAQPATESSAHDLHPFPPTHLGTLRRIWLVTPDTTAELATNPSIAFRLPTSLIPNPLENPTPAATTTPILHGPTPTGNQAVPNPVSAIVAPEDSGKVAKRGEMLSCSFTPEAPIVLPRNSLVVIALPYAYGVPQAWLPKSGLDSVSELVPLPAPASTTAPTVLAALKGASIIYPL